MKKLWNGIKAVLMTVFLILPLVLIGFVLAQKMQGKVPALFGYSLSVVVTPSMQDVLPVGSIILTHEYDPAKDTLEVGQYVTYVGKSGSAKGLRITHEIIDVKEENGEAVITTKGTNNAEADAPIAKSDIESLFVCKIVSLGKVYDLLGSKSGFLLILVVPIILLIGYEMWNLMKVSKEMKEEKAKESAENDPETPKKQPENSENQEGKTL